MKMIRDQIYSIKETIKEIKELELEDVKFNFAMSKNLKLFTNECDVMDEQIKPSAKFMEFETKRVDKLKEKSEKDENGNPKLIGDPKRPQYKLQEDKLKEFSNEMLILSGEYTDEIDKRNKMLMDFDKMLGEEVPEEFIKQIFKYTIIVDDNGLPINLPKGLKQKYIDSLLNIILIEKPVIEKK